MARAYRCRPSELYQIEHPVQRFYFDRAVWVFGTTLDADLEEAGKKAKKPAQATQARMRVLQKWLGTAVAGFRKAEPTKRSTPTK